MPHSDSSPEVYFTIAELAREFDITTRTIRFYEDRQLLTPARRGNQRVYSRADRTRLKLVLRGKRLGWPLDDIREMIALYDTPDGEKKTAACHDKQNIPKSRNVAAPAGRYTVSFE